MAGGAIVLISLIAYVASNPSKEIIKALMVVMLIKLTLSPHAPITAYLAVGFQGLLGALLFRLLPHGVASFILGVVGMLETAFQKLLTLTLLFGRSLWSSIDIFIESVMQRLGYAGNEAYSIRVVAVYLLVYLIGGLIIGIVAARLPHQVSKKISEGGGIVDHEMNHPAGLVSSGSEVKRGFPIPKLVIVILFLLVLAYYFVPGIPDSLDPLFLIARVVLIILVWFLVVSPLLMKLLERFLRNRESTYSQDVNLALQLIPSFKSLIIRSWEESKSISGLKRYSTFIVNSIAYCILYSDESSEA